MQRTTRALAGLVLACVCGGATAADVYAPYAFLIGDWDISPEAGGPAVAGARISWGTGRSYIWYVGTINGHGGQQPHFEGMLLWNGVKKNLDMLLALDLQGGRAQEQGAVSVEPDGTVVREITASYSEGTQPLGGAVAGPAGSTARFRQTFKAAGPDRVRTSVLRETPHGWVATFPGSDHLVMTRRSKGAS